MDSIVITWRELLIAVIMVLAVYAAELLLLLRNGRPPRLPFPRRGRNEVGAQPYAIGALRDEIAELRRSLSALRADVDALRQPAAAGISTSQSTPYARAIELARHGGDAVSLARDCGISRGEAELIVALHSARR